MTYGHSNRARAEDAIVERSLERTAGAWGGYQAWRQLNAEKRLKLIEQALGCPANDLDCCSHCHAHENERGKDGHHGG